MAFLTSKSIFASKTFWGAIFTLISSVTPLVVNSIHNKGVSVNDGAEIALILSGVGATIFGRVTADTAISTGKENPTIS